MESQKMNELQVHFISTKSIRPATHSGRTDHEQIRLNAWDLMFLNVNTIQKGLLFLNPSNQQQEAITPSTASLIHRLETSLAFALDRFFPLAGRLASTKTRDKIAFHISCNNAGAEFIHATATHLTVSDILKPLFVPRIVHAFFPLNKTLNYDHGTPLLAVQVTELLDGIFLGISMNHSVVDGTSFWHFVNSWAQISRAHDVLNHDIDLPSPVLQRWFPNEVNCPIQVPNSFHSQETAKHHLDHPVGSLEERVFHFSPQSIAKLKAKANAELLVNETDQKRPIISSLQALLAHIWITVTRARCLGYNEETSYCIIMGNRAKLLPPLPQDYFGSSVAFGTATVKVGELLENGLGWAASKLNQVVIEHTNREIRSFWESWVKKPRFLSLNQFPCNLLVTGSSPRFDVYGNDFGWGKPVAVRSGDGNKRDGKITVFPGATEASMDFEACLCPETLVAMGDDEEFMKFITSSPLGTN